MSQTRDPWQILIWLAGLAVAGLVLVFSLLWSFAPWRQPDAPTNGAVMLLSSRWG